MQINKKILLISLIMSFNSAIMSMEQAELQQQAHNTYTSLEYILGHGDHYKNNVSNLAKWLVQERTKISQTDEWKTSITTFKDIVEALINSNPKLNSDGFAKGHWESILESAYKLEPNISDTQLIKAIDETTYDKVWSQIGF